MRRKVDDVHVGVVEGDMSKSLSTSAIAQREQPGMSDDKGKMIRFKLIGKNQKIDGEERRSFLLIF